MPIRYFIDLSLKFLQWPIGIVSTLLLPAMAVSFWNLLQLLWKQHVWTSSFGIGMTVGFVFWLMAGKTRFVRFWSTMEHELTHALFAWLTLVPVVELRTSDGSSGENALGHVRLGGDNWLIAAGPYFFPTLAVFVWLAIVLLAEEPSQLARGILGAAFVINIASSIRETHREQADLQQIGWIFSLLFLPAANLFCYGLLLAYEVGGMKIAKNYATETFALTHTWLTR